MKKTSVLRIAAALSSLCVLQAGAQSAEVTDASLKAAAQSAVLQSPEVKSSWHTFAEADHTVSVARGGFFPKVDLVATTGHNSIEQDRVGTDLSYHGNYQALTLDQMIFDGFATSSEVKRLGRAKLVRYFELLDASETAALEASKAYLDVIRYRQHVALAEDNYIQHQAAYEQLKKRANSGVGKGVDVDQAASRLALADVNLTTAYANLHDVTARYIRVVGAEPPKDMSLPEGWKGNLPASESEAVQFALTHNPALRASIENIEAAQFGLEGRRSAFMPRLDLVGRREHYSNYEDAGSRDESSIALRLSYNLFNGGSDVAQSHQYRERKNVAMDLREKACRDMRQTLSIAYNDSARLEDQRDRIAEQASLVERTRAAYRDQFNIGQRTLLDLLNTQNEYFDARRAEVDANVDLSLAHLRSLEGMGVLLETLGLKHLEPENQLKEGDFTPVDVAQLCPADTPTAVTLNREALKQKARETIDSAGLVSPRQR